jgi:hypothetical protein
MDVKKSYWWMSGASTVSAFVDVWGWWRADTYSGSSPNIVLTDKSTNGRNMTQAAGTLTPGTAANGQAQFTGGATARLTTSGSLESWPCTIITIAKRANNATCGFFGHTGASPFSTLWSGFEASNANYIYNNNGTVNTTAEAGTTACYVARVGYGSRTAILNGLILPVMTLANVARSSAITASLGTQYRGLNCDWQETLVWNRTLTLSELDEVHTYINTRYGMSIPLWSSYTSTPVVWMGGQSNSSGRGDRGASDVNIPAKYKAVLTGVNVWFGVPASEIGTAFSTLSIASNNQMLGDSAQATTYIGHELSMMKDYLDRVGGTVYLSKYSRGSTFLNYDASTTDFWHPIDGGLAHNNAHRMYAQSMLNWWKALQVHQAANRIPSIKGLVWYQGEQDATVQAYSDVYSAAGVAFFNQLEPELGYKVNTLKKIIMRLNASCTSTYTSTVRTQQATLVSTLQNATMVDTDSYGLRGGDVVHLSYQGQLDLGTYLASQL